jgi:hypothetical protein
MASGDVTGYALLATAYGHLDRCDEARSALAAYRRATDRPIAQVVAEHWLPLAVRQIFLDGIMLAEGGTSADAASRAE